MSPINRRYSRGVVCLHGAVRRGEFEMDFEHALRIFVESLRVTRIAPGRVRACRNFGAKTGDNRSDPAHALPATIFLPLSGCEPCGSLEMASLVFETFSSARSVAVFTAVSLRRKTGHPCPMRRHPCRNVLLQGVRCRRAFHGNCPVYDWKGRWSVRERTWISSSEVIWAWCSAPLSVNVQDRFDCALLYLPGWIRPAPRTFDRSTVNRRHCRDAGLWLFLSLSAAPAHAVATGCAAAFVPAALAQVFPSAAFVHVAAPAHLPGPWLSSVAGSAESRLHAADSGSPGSGSKFVASPCAGSVPRNTVVARSARAAIGTEFRLHWSHPLCCDDHPA